MVAGLLLFLHPTALSQVTSAPQSQEALPADILILKLSPGKWSHEVKGEVRSIETVQLRPEIRNGQPVETPLSSQTVYFDRRGFETETIESGEARTIWKYDTEGRPSEMTMVLEGASFMRLVYHYDLKQRKVTTETYAFGSDELHSREISTFDERWNEIRMEREFFTEAGDSRPRKEVTLYTLTYDSKGRVIASTIENESGATSHRFTEEYDASNRLIKSVSLEYNETSGKILSRTVNTYDGQGNLVSGLNYNSLGSLQRRESYTREFDARGNWITERRTTWANVGPGGPYTFTIIKRRRITFY